MASQIKIQIKRWGLKLGPYFIILLIALMVLWPQRVSRSLFLGADSIFHMNQFYESAMQIKTGHMSWFLTLFGFSRNARIVNAVYGPAFSYLMGRLLLFLGTWFRFEFVFSLITITIAGMLMTWLAHRCHMNYVISTLLGIMYMFSLPVFSFVTDQSFDGVGLAFLPLAVWFGIKMWKQRRVDWLPLAILMALVIQIHLLTAVMFTVMLIPFAIVSFTKSYHKLQWLWNGIKAVLLTIILTGNVWGSILEVMTTNHTIPPFPNRKMTNPEFAVQWTVQHHRLAIVGNVFLWIALLILLFAIIQLMTHRQFDSFQCFMAFMGGLFFWISSAYFPWLSIIQIWPMVRQTIQFPRRFVGIFVIFTLLTLGSEVERLGFTSHSFQNYKYYAGLILLIITALFMSFSEFHSVKWNVANWQSRRIVTAAIIHPKIPLNEVRKTANDFNLGDAPKIFVKSVPDYLPSNRKVNYKNFYDVHPYGRNFRKLMEMKAKAYRVISPTGQAKYWYAAVPKSNPMNIHKSIVGRNIQAVTWNQPISEAHQWTRIPVVKYRHTQVMLNGQPLRHVRINSIGAILLRPQAGQNRLTLRYRPATWWKIVIVITVLSWLVLLIGCLIRLLVNY